MGHVCRLWLIVILTLFVVEASSRVIPQSEDPSLWPGKLGSTFAPLGHDSGRTGDKISQQEEIGNDPFDPEDSWETGPDLHRPKDGLMEFIMETVEHFQRHVSRAAAIVVPIGIVVMSLLCCLTFTLDQPVQEVRASASMGRHWQWT